MSEVQCGCLQKNNMKLASDRLEIWVHVWLKHNLSELFRRHFSTLNTYPCCSVGFYVNGRSLWGLSVWHAGRSAETSSAIRSVEHTVQNFALPYRSEEHINSPSELSNVSHTFVVRRVLRFDLRFTQAEEFTGTVLIALFLLRYVNRMHRAGLSCKVFLPGSL